MDRIPVVSSTIDEIGYNAACRTLEILFKSGAVYLYYFVPQEVYDALMAADSKGTYYFKQIKGLFEHHQIREPYGSERIRSRPRRRRCPTCGRTWRRPA